MSLPDVDATDTIPARSCLVSIFGPGNVLAAIAAVRWNGVQRGGHEAAQVLTLLHHPSLPEDAAREATAVVRRLIGSQGWRRLLTLRPEEMGDIVGRGAMWTRYATVLRRFRRRIGAERFDEVYFAHDIVGRASELALNAYPHATHITFGDALGSLYDKRYHLALASGTGRPPRARQYSRGNRLFPANPLRELGGLARRLVLGAPEQIPAREAVLILPMDQSGACLSGKRLRVVPRELVLQIIQECKRAVPELRRYCTGLIAKTPAPHYLMLLENLADGGFTSFEQEVAMYEEMVRCHVPAGATVFIKAHPSSVAPVDEALRDRLRVDYTPAAVSREFRRYPMELWSDLISACRVVSMSYCSISLAYLYAVPVIYPMESRIIETYIPRRFWESYKDADDLYRGQLANLAGWDGQSVLWAGSLT